ncbi:MAG TPA: lysine--tRNA ligase, partial [Gammaproteobacteria bacterium]|nr:lysine--tRNA ligase [Gammaproteobacteria bacterium]
NKNVQVKCAGRIMTRRNMGKASFVHLKDMTGLIQVYIKQDLLPDHVYESFKHWDLGDIVAIEGVVFKTKTGELSIRASNIKLLSKALRPLPDKYHGLHDQEVCYRQRYLDLMVNQKTQKVFQIRSKLIQSLRDFLLERQFLEVETPMMQVIPGGAAAKPFETYHNALDMPLFLRIAPELYLKRLVVGGFEQVFEINRNFRNEGLSTRHNPEFTMVEFYWAYADYQDLMTLTEEMMRYLAMQVLGTYEISYQENIIDFSKQFPRLTVQEAILQFNSKLTKADLGDLTSMIAYAKTLEIPLKPEYGLGKVLTEIFEKTAEPNLQGPLFITEYPAEVSPLARRKDSDPFVTDRFEFFIGGREIANGFSELNDPDDQRERFLKQIEAAKAGDEEAMRFDEDYLTALEYGMPPTAGEGIGIDRLAMVFADCASIRDVILFPHMRPTDK